MSARAMFALLPLLLAAFVSSRSNRVQAKGLNGAWRVTLILDSAKLLEGQPSGDTVRGHIRFGAAFQTFSMHRTVDTAGAVFGTHDLDFRPFWGGPIPPDYSTSILAPGTSSPITEVFARVNPRDSIVVSLNPRFSHGRVDLTGRRDADSLLVGTWFLYSRGSRAAGHFSMVRDSSR